VARTLGDTGIRILVRIMGLLLVALTVQYFVNGVADLRVIATQSPSSGRGRRRCDG